MTADGHAVAPQFVRVAALQGADILLSIDGAPVRATAGQSLLSAILLHGRVARHSEFTDEPRAGFCLMGACQDCWVWTEAGTRLRACTTPASDGMAVLTRPPAFGSAP